MYWWNTFHWAARPLFPSRLPRGCKNLQLIHDSMELKCPRLVMSATLRKVDQQTISKLFGGEPGFILWKEMARRRIMIDVVVSGNPTQAMRKTIKGDLTKDPTMKIIWINLFLIIQYKSIIYKFCRLFPRNCSWHFLCGRPRIRFCADPSLITIDPPHYYHVRLRSLLPTVTLWVWSSRDFLPT